MNSTLENSLHSWPWPLSAVLCTFSKSLSARLVIGDPQIVYSSCCVFPRYEPGIWAAEVLMMHSRKGHQQELCFEHVKWPRKPGPWGSSQRHLEGRETATLISLFLSFQFGKQGCLTINVLVNCLAAALGKPVKKPVRKPPVLYSEQGLAWGHTLNNEEKTKYWIAACSANSVPLRHAGPCVRECKRWDSFLLALGARTSLCT